MRPRSCHRRHHRAVPRREQKPIPPASPREGRKEAVLVRAPPTGAAAWRLTCRARRQMREGLDVSLHGEYAYDDDAVKNAKKALLGQLNRRAPTPAGGLSGVKGWHGIVVTVCRRERDCFG